MRIEEAIDTEGFQLWRLRKKAQSRIFVLRNRPTRCRPMVDPSSIDEGTELLSPFTHGARRLDVTEVALFDPYAAAVGGRARAEVRADGQPQP